MRTDQYVAAAAVGNQFSKSAHSTAPERHNSVRDMWSSVHSRHVLGEDFLAFVETCNDDTDPQTWSIIGGALTEFHRSTSGDDRLRFEELVRNLLRPHFQVLGWRRSEYESNQRETTRGILAELLGTIGGDTEVRRMCARLFVFWQAQHQTVEDSLLPALVNSIAETGTSDQYLTFIKLAQQAHSDRECRLFLEALGRFEGFDCRSAMNTVTATVDNEQALGILCAYVGNERSALSAWNYIKTIWHCMPYHFPVHHLLPLFASLSSLDTPDLQRDLNQFFRLYSQQGPSNPITSLLVSVAANVNFRGTARQALARYYTRMGGPSHVNNKDEHEPQ